MLVCTALVTVTLQYFLTSAPFALLIFGIARYFDCDPCGVLVFAHLLTLCLAFTQYCSICVSVFVGGVCPLVRSDTDRPVLYLCTVWKESCQHCVLSSQARLLHFNLRHGPENYVLRTCSVQAFAAELFCTWKTFLHLLCKHFTYTTSQGLASPHLCTSRQNRLKLEWVPKPEKLPQDQYDKQQYRGLTVHGTESTPSDDVVNNRWSSCEITDRQGFLEELLKVSLAEGFKVDLVVPDPAEILNCTSIRMVKG